MRAMVWRRLRRNPSAIIGIIGILTMTFVAVAAPLLANGIPILCKYDGKVYAPGLVECTWIIPYASDLLQLSAPFDDATFNLERSLEEEPDRWQWVIPPLISHDPLAIDTSIAKSAPSSSYLLGTDRYGRDVLSRVIYGTRISLLVGLISQGIAVFIGVGLGALAGYYRGWTDGVVMWLVNVVWSFPFLLFVLAVVVAIGESNIITVYIAVGLAAWVGHARIIRGQFLSLREKEFVDAARALGLSPIRIAFLHILPNCIGPLIVMVTLGFAQAIIAEASLSFLGLGAQPPTPSWGNMIYENFRSIQAGTDWWSATFAGVAVMLAVMSFNVLGDRLRDALDPRDRG